MCANKGFERRGSSKAVAELGRFRGGLEVATGLPVSGAQAPIPLCLSAGSAAASPDALAGRVSTVAEGRLRAGNGHNLRAAPIDADRARAYYLLQEPCDSEVKMRLVGLQTLFLLSVATAAPVTASGEAGPYPADVAAVLEASGENRAELEKVLHNYAAPADSLKLRAAYYLIGNMEGHSYVTYGLHDSAGAEVAFDVLDYPDYGSLRETFDTLESQWGTLEFERREPLADMHSITADFLVTQIDYAFRAWREKPWAAGLSFEAFCEYVLPFRGSNEPLEPWRAEFWDRYADVADGSVDPSDPVAVARLINDDIRSWFRFDERYYYHPTDQGLSEMLENQMGRCEDMTNITIYAMRANGLAVTSDYTPYWADAGNNHAWNAIVTGSGKVIPFMGAESNPGEYHLAHKMAKVYRKTYGKQPGNLTFQERKQEKIPRWLSGKSYLDVTADYTDVCDVTVTFDGPIPDSVDIAYLCVFNSGEWQAIHWGTINNGAALFTDMGANIAYLPALFLNEEVYPFGDPFILRSDCSPADLGPESGSPISVTLVSATRPKATAAAGAEMEVFLTAGTAYELFYWSDGWQSAGTSIADGGPMVIDGVPSGALYWLVPEGSNRENERIFTFAGGQQVWW